MTLGPVLDVVIGLVFVYILLGMLASTLQESLASYLNWRGKALREALGRMLATQAGGGGGALFERVFSHALVAGTSARKAPSYLPARSFATALLDRMRDGSLDAMSSQVERAIVALPADSPVRETLLAHFNEAKGDVEAFRARVEQWFDDAMDRLSGTYKRKTQAWLVAFGMIAAVGMNVDSIEIAKTLWRDAGARTAIVGAAQNFATANQDGLPAQTAEAVQAQLAMLPIPIGWTELNCKATRGTAPTDKPCAKDEDHFSVIKVALYLWNSGSAGAWTVIGWIITGFAVALGAPFWFDMLQKLLNLRGAGPRPARADAIPEKP